MELGELNLKLEVQISHASWGELENGETGRWGAGGGEIPAT